MNSRSPIVLSSSRDCVFHTLRPPAASCPRSVNSKTPCEAAQCVLSRWSQYARQLNHRCAHLLRAPALHCHTKLPGVLVHLLAAQAIRPAQNCRAESAVLQYLEGAEQAVAAVAQQHAEQLAVEDSSKSLELACGTPPWSVKLLLIGAAQGLTAHPKSSLALR